MKNLKFIFVSINLFFGLCLWLGACRDSISVDQVDVSSRQKGVVQDRERKDLIDSVLRIGDSKDFYWYQGRKIALTYQPNSQVIVFPSSKRSQIQDSYNPIERRKEFGFPLEEIANSKRTSVRSITDREELLVEIVKTPSHALSRSSDIIFVGETFLAPHGETLYLTPIVYVKLAPSSQLSDLEYYAEALNFSVLGEVQSMPEWLIVRCESSHYSPLEIADILYNDRSFVTAYPYFVSERKLFSAPNDPLYASQWALQNLAYHKGVDIGILDAWNLNQGDPQIIVAVIDEGVDLAHPDLNLYHFSYDAHTGSSPSQIHGRHGTACAGIIGAHANNGMGIAGVAPRSSIMPISVNFKIGRSSTDAQFADAINTAWRQGASVLINA